MPTLTPDGGRDDLRGLDLPDQHLAVYDALMARGCEHLPTHVAYYRLLGTLTLPQILERIQIEVPRPLGSAGRAATGQLREELL